MQIGVHGVFAQYYRDQLVENVHMGNRQAAESGHWINRAPTGYDMIDGELVPNEMAPLVQRAFALRASGSSYPAISDEVGIGYSTVRHICENRAYLGQVRLRDEWFDGRHPALVSLDQFNAAQRAHTPGKRRSKELLSGVVRCGLCGQVAGVQYNERNQPLYRCKHRGKGCAQPGRSANGLHRAMLVGLRELTNDTDLQAAIRDELTAHHRDRPPEPAGPTAAATIRALTLKRGKLLDLYYADQITPEAFAPEEQRLTAQIATLQVQAEALDAEHQQRDRDAERFDNLTEVLNSLDLDAIWDEATSDERRLLVADLVDAVCIYPDQITVQVAGAPPVIVSLSEVGLRAGTNLSCRRGDLNS